MINSIIKRYINFWNKFFKRKSKNKNGRVYSEEMLLTLLYDENIQEQITKMYGQKDHPAPSID